MASVHPRKNKAGDVTAWLVKWRTGGVRTAQQQTERFDPDEEGLAAAGVFRDAVNECGQQWPLGWVKGQGMVAPDADSDDQYRFVNYAVESVKNRTGVEERYRDACIGELERYIFPTFANCDVRSTDHFSKRTIQAWVNLMAETVVRRGSKHKKMSPKTIKNLHGLLSSILNEAAQADPPLRDRNPCKSVRLPRTDDDGTGGDDEDEDIEFLEPSEVAAIASCMRTPKGRRLVEDLYGTGARWGEASAWACKHMILTDPSRPRVRIRRAWKWCKSRGYYLGPPKSKRSRRTMGVAEHTHQNWVEQGLHTKDKNALVYDNGNGGRLPYSTFYDEWEGAKEEAKELGLLPEHKNPTIHDLRHSHAAALISAGHPLTYVQRRLGHESIKTTSDLYGHLLPEADQAAMTTIGAALEGRTVMPGMHPEAASVPAPRPVVRPAAASSVLYVVVFPGGHQEAFWRADFARLVAEVWKLERRTAASLEERATHLWEARHGGLGGVHDGMPDRARLWEVGPVVYGPDGAEEDTAPGVHTLRERWVWVWESDFTTEPAAWRAEHRPAPSLQTEAAAWGVDKARVQASFVKARTKALRICGRHPSVLTARAVQTDS